jgi:REP element-mobilizing transposase RayT
MPRPLRLEREGAFWHITSRGNERRDIYRDRNDRSVFLEMLGEAVMHAQWRLHAYVLMSNHYHLLVETPRLTLSEGVKQLNERWANYFNWRYERVGHLFQGRFKAVLIEREEHLREVLRYVVLNAVRCGAVEYAADDEWSSYRATAGLVSAPPWLDVDWTLAQFHEDRTVATELYRTFVAEGRGAKWCDWETPTASHDTIRAKAVEGAICAAFGETAETLRTKSRVSRKAFAQLARDECGMLFPEIGNRLGVTATAAAKMAAAGRSLEKADFAYAATIARARDRLSSVMGSDPSQRT